MDCIESRFAVGPSNILFAGVFPCTFQTENFTGWGSEVVNGSVITNLTMSTIELLSRKISSIHSARELSRDKRVRKIPSEEMVCLCHKTQRMAQL